MIKIGITGGICSGKTSVCKELEKLGYKVFYSDIEAKKIANENSFLKSDIIKAFGVDSYINGVYNTAYIASIVFSNKEKLAKLDSLFKDYLEMEWERFIVINSEEETVFYESALIKEHSISYYFDKVVGIYANESTIIERLKERNGYTLKEIDKRLKSQMKSVYKMAACDASYDSEILSPKEIADEIINDL